MPKVAQSDILTADIAVSIRNVTKDFVQWQRSGKLKDMVKNLVSPQKRVVTALDNVSLTVRKGEFVAYAGANGAGKSTTLKILSGIMQPTSGEVEVLGLDPKVSRVELMRHVGVVFGQRTELWWDHPIAMSYEWKKAVWDIDDAEYERNLKTIVDLLELQDLMKTFARELSLGQRMRADLGLVLLHNPKLIFLDEPTLGLDVLAKRHMIDFLKRINKEQGTTIVVTSHDMDDLEEMAERIVLLSQGQIAFDGSFAELRDLTGSVCRIRLTVLGEGVPSISSGTLVSADQNVFEFEFDTTLVPVREVLAQISQIEGVVDIEIRKAPIEKIVAELYTKWKR